MPERNIMAGDLDMAVYGPDAVEQIIEMTDMRNMIKASARYRLAVYRLDGA